MHIEPPVVIAFQEAPSRWLVQIVRNASDPVEEPVEAFRSSESAATFAAKLAERHGMGLLVKPRVGLPYRPQVIPFVRARP